MGHSSLRTLASQLRHLATDPDTNRLTDCQLLARFVADRDEVAFALLVRRHSALVRGVCRRVVPVEEDADDVFQATFLVLARKAGKVRWRASVAGWLYEVAYRLASEARKRHARRQRREREAAMMTKSDPEADSARRELCAVLDEELHRLPATERPPLLLCYLHGRTRDEAARQLGCSLRTLDRRLQSGRERLRARLLRRGVTLSTALLLPEFLSGKVLANSGALAASVARMATLFAADELSAATGSTAVALAQRFLRSMARLKTGLWTLVVAGMAALAGTGALASRTGERHTLIQPDVGRSSVAAATGWSDEQPMPVRMDRYGDPLPAGALARLGTIRFRHSDLTDLVFTPDGQHIISAGSQAARVWDLATERETRRFVIPGARADQLLVSGNGAELFSLGSDGKVHHWDRAGGKLLHLYAKLTEDMNGFALSPDGKTLATASSDFGTPKRFYVRLLDVATARVLHTFTGHEGSVCSLAFSPDGAELASVAAAAIPVLRVWSVTTGAKRGRHMLPFRFDAQVWRCPLLYAPGGKTLILGGKDHVIHLIDARTGQESSRLVGHTDAVCALGLCAGGRLLASASIKGTVRLWDLATGKELRKLERAGYRLAFSRDGSLLATGAQSIRFWDPTTGRELRPTGGHQRWIGSAVLSPDGQIVATAGLWTMRLWDAATGRERNLIQGRQNGLAFTPDGKLLAGAGQDGIIRFWDPHTGVEIRHFSAKVAGALAFSPDGRVLAAGSVDRTIRLWDPRTTREIRHWRTGQKGAMGLAFSPNGKTLASTGYFTHEVHLWDTASGRELRRLHCGGGGALCVAFAPDGQTLATAGLEEPIRLWDIGTGRLLVTLRRDPDPKDYNHVVRQMVFSPDGRTLFSAEQDGTVRLWETATAALRRELTGHLDDVYAVGLSADARHLVSAGYDTTALVWELTGRSTQKLEDSWRALRGTDVRAAYQAVLDLSASGTPALALLSHRLHPVSPAKPARVARLIADLDDPKFPIRERAQAALAAVAESAEPAFRGALHQHLTPEQRRRVERLLVGLSSARVGNRRALEVLERMDNSGVRQLLQDLAAGAPEASLTREAKATLPRWLRRHASH